MTGEHADGEQEDVKWERKHIIAKNHPRPRSTVDARAPKWWLSIGNMGCRMR